MRKRNPAKPVGSEPRPKSKDDLWADELRAECARAMVHYLKQGTNVKKPIASLSERELLGLAEACNARWIKRVSERLANGRSEPLGDEAEAAFLLFGM